MHMCLRAAQKTYSFRDRHKVTDDIRCVTVTGPPASICFLKSGITEPLVPNIAKTYSHKLCIRSVFAFDRFDFKLLAVCLFCRSSEMLKLLLDAVFPMRKQQQAADPACHSAADNIHALITISHRRLLATHDIGGVYGFIGTGSKRTSSHRDFNAAQAVLYTDHIIFNRFIRACFHQRHMLMRCSMVNNIRRYVSNTCSILRVSRTEPIKVCGVQSIAVFTFELLLNRIGVILIDIKDDKHLRLCAAI